MKKYRDKNWLKEQIEEKKRSRRSVAEEEGVSPTTISNWAKEFGIEREYKYKDESWLKEETEEKDRTLSDIAEECDVTLSAISKWITRHGIELERTSQ